jgi:hypothetical protein
VQDPDDPDVMTPEARAREVAELLATGYLRHRALRARGAASTCASGPSDGRRQPENEVDDPRDRSVHVPHADGSAPAAEQEVLG